MIANAHALVVLCAWAFTECRERAVAEIKIAFAVFLQAYTGDVNLATAALDAANLAEPSLEGEFELFSRIRRLQQMRQAASLGSQQLSSA